MRHRAPRLFGRLGKVSARELLVGVKQKAVGHFSVVFYLRQGHAYPTVPSRLTRSSWLASAANSKGSSLKMPRQKPLIIM